LEKFIFSKLCHLTVLARKGSDIPRTQEQLGKAFVV